MTDLDLLHFEQLKAEVQNQYLKEHSPSTDAISKWKGIDIIYFQEDLRKKAKGNISEKSFYTYFKSTSPSKLPRIDMLNLLSIYAGFTSWYDFKKNHLFANETLAESERETGPISIANEEDEKPEKSGVPHSKDFPKAVESEAFEGVLQNSTSENQLNSKKTASQIDVINSTQKNFRTTLRKNMWLGISAILAVAVGLLIFGDRLFTKEFTYSFIDEDRNSRINADLDVQILKENESPILFTVRPNAQFKYPTKSKSLVMVVSSPYYRTDTIYRNLETAPRNENIVLKPNDNAIMLYYYSKSIKDLKKKRASLNYLIADDALIYQVFDNEFYGVETMDKQRYITLVTLPSTSLENLDVITTTINNQGKIVMIKFKIGNNEKTP